MTTFWDPQLCFYNFWFWNQNSPFCGLFVFLRWFASQITAENWAWWQNEWADYIATGHILGHNPPGKVERPQIGMFWSKFKNFHKSKVDSLKKFSTRAVCLMICCILGDVHLQNLSFLREPSTEFSLKTFLTLPYIPGSLRIKIRTCLFFQIYFQRIAIVLLPHSEKESANEEHRAIREPLFHGVGRLLPMPSFRLNFHARF